MYIERLNYSGLNCYRLANGVLELIITGDVGPRIIRFGFIGEHNEFYQADPLAIPADRSAWQLYGGHRLWHAPEAAGRTTVPDNTPISVEDHGDLVRIVQPTDAAGIEKQIDIHLTPASNHVRLTHRLINHNLWGIELAVWALSVMTPSGTAVIPLPPRGSHPEDLLPTATLAIWPYVDLSDPRFGFGRKYIRIAHNPHVSTPLKLGAAVPSGWIAYTNANHLFIKQFEYAAGAVYPDLGSNVEVFANDFMLELETLSPLITLAPAASVEHIERWTLVKDVPEVASDDAIDRYVLPVVNG